MHTNTRLPLQTCRGRGYNEKMPAKKQIDKAKYLGLVSETIWEICDEGQMVHLPDSMSLRHLPEGDIAELHGHIIVSSRLRDIFLSPTPQGRKPRLL